MIAIERLADLSPERRASLVQRGRREFAALAGTVAAIVADVRVRGDAALRDYTQRFDGVDVPDAAVPEADLVAALAGADPDYLTALRAAAAHIHAFHAAQVPVREPPAVQTTPGVRVWRVWRAIERVGVYVPGGRARYPSTVLMTAIPAAVAGVGDVVICTPPGPDGRVPAEVLAAAAVAGARRVFAVGGAQAIAAMAFGTATVPRVDKIVGPGNGYVAAAKLHVAAEVVIDAPAGPSEILILADDGADPRWLAADLLAQAEHGPDSAPVLVTTSREVAAGVLAAIEAQLAVLATAATIRQSLAGQGAILLADDLEAALAFANDYAPEHLELAVRDPERWLPQVRHAGTVFLGAWSPEAAGDYATGANHTLPTAGFARGFGPLSVENFGRWMQAQTVAPEGLAVLRPTIERLAAIEGLPAHAASVQARFAGPVAAASSPIPQAAPGPVWLNANENPYGASPKALAAVARVSDNRGRYPDAAQRELRAGIAASLGLAPDQIIAGNGSDELLHFLTLETVSQPGDEIIICEPTFMIYRFEARNAGATIVEVPLDADFRVDRAALRAAITPRTRLIWFCSPNNPTGTPFDLDVLPDVAGRGPLLAVDEAYYPFSDVTALPLLAQMPDLVVVRTMSKIAGLAGLRVGYAAAAPDIIARLDAHRHPFNVNAVAEAAALATLADGEWLAEIKQVIAAERERLAARLVALPGVTVWPSAANFLLVDLPVNDAAPVNAALAKRGIHVRYAPQPRLRRALRVTVGTPAENDAFGAALAEILAALPAAVQR